MVKKWLKMVKNLVLCKWWENAVVIACSSFYFEDSTATAPSDNIFVNKSGGGIKGLPMSRHKW